jgi:hypothetical protein
MTKRPGVCPAVFISLCEIAGGLENDRRASFVGARIRSAKTGFACDRDSAHPSKKTGVVSRADRREIICPPDFPAQTKRACDRSQALLLYGARSWTRTNDPLINSQVL